MGKERVRDTSQRRDKGKEQLRKPSREKRRDLIRVRQAIYELSPPTLKEFLSMLEEEDGVYDPMTEPDEPATEDLLDLDADMVIEDDDEDFTEEEHEDYFEAPMVFLDTQVGYAETPLLLRGSKYTLIIAKRSGEGYACRFEGPLWVYRNRLSEKSRLFVTRLRLFLGAVAEWLEDDKQLFLEKPIPENYVSGEMDFLENPIVLQSGFLATINDRLPPDFHLGPSDFTRLIDHIWLLWPQWNMPLRHLFSGDYRLAWAVEGIADSYKEYLRWEKDGLTYPDFGKEDLQRAKKKRFNQLDPVQRLYVLCDRVGVKKREVLKNLSAK